MTSGFRLGAIVAVWIACAVVPDMTAGQEDEHAERSSFRDRSARYRLQSSDVLDVRFRFSPEFNEMVTVQPDGFISLQIAGEIKVEGLTAPETADAIRQKCDGVLRDPVITVALKEFKKPVFYVAGNVSKPGSFDYRSDMTVTEAITVAGGFAPGAKDTDVFLFRRVSQDTVEVKRIDVKSAIEKDALREDLGLEPNDSIYVSKSKTGKLERFMQISRLGLYFDPLPFTIH
ncbi:MAG: polysaccharide biosynthesis/export family protein [Bryobacteraceae bacterium]|jgi:polysaccharide export outer membrane protein